MWAWRQDITLYCESGAEGFAYATGVINYNEQNWGGNKRPITQRMV